MRVPAPTVLKIGGELLEDPAQLNAVVAAVAASVHVSATGAGPSRPLVIVHGGGKEIDAALKAAGIEKRQVEGLRITDAPTLGVVVSVLAGAVNTRLVAALGAASVRAVGLTGVDGRCGLAERAPAHATVDGRFVDLGHVGVPSDRADVRLVQTLSGVGFVPVIACIGVTTSGDLLNVNADTFAGHVAAKLGAGRLVIAGTTPGVLDDDGATISFVDAASIRELVASGTATAGMIAKLRACEHAVINGVDDVVIVGGHDGTALELALQGAVPPASTQVMAGLKTCTTTETLRSSAETPRSSAATPRSSAGL